MSNLLSLVGPSESEKCLRDLRQERKSYCKESFLSPCKYDTKDGWEGRSKKRRGIDIWIEGLENPFQETYVDR